MNFWHIQMYLPHGEEGEPIDSRQMLKRNIPVIGTGEWDNLQCRNFKNETGGGLEIGDTVLVREGGQVIALCEVTSPSFRNQGLEKEYGHVNYRNVKILDWYRGQKPFPQTRGTLQRLTNEEKSSWKFMNAWYTKLLSEKNMEQYMKALKYKKQIVLQGPPGTGKTRLAKQLARELIQETREENGINLEDTDKYKLIQFHPSYTYEDFVRGIQPKASGRGISFDTINRVILDLATQAVNDSQENEYETVKEYSLHLADKFLEGIIKEEIKMNPALVMKVDEEKLTLSHKDYSRQASGFSISRKKIADECRYLIQGDREGNSDPLWHKLMEPLKRELGNLIPKNPITFPFSPAENELGNYVLIIDEINRANLSSVLGELIYALEYRDEPIESIYEKDNSREIIIPSNLFIIGTMNTADRSVGAIDYAVRRRFAFLDVLPDRDAIELESGKVLYDRVNKIFDDNGLSREFNKKDVQLGHSYFIADSDEILVTKLECEIKPILREYVNDGILLRSVNDQIEDLNVA